MWLWKKKMPATEKVEIIRLVVPPIPEPILIGRAFWTEEKVESLRRYWLGGMNARLIAKQLGTTRNAVIGKAHRLGIEFGSEPTEMVRNYGRI